MDILPIFVHRKIQVMVRYSHLHNRLPLRVLSYTDSTLQNWLQFQSVRTLAFCIHQCMFLKQTIYNMKKHSIFQPIERTSSESRAAFHRVCWKEAGFEGSLLASFHRFWDAISGRVTIVCMLCRSSLQALARLTDMSVQPVTVARGMISLST